MWIHRDFTVLNRTIRSGVMGNFCLLIETLKVERVEELVSGGSPDISYMDNEKRSPLHAAAFVGNSDIVEILIDQVVNGYDWYI